MKEEISWEKAMTLESYVRKLIDRGKRSKDAEFQTLISLYGDKKIRSIVAKYFEERKKKC